MKEKINLIYKTFNRIISNFENFKDYIAYDILSSHCTQFSYDRCTLYV